MIAQTSFAGLLVESDYGCLVDRSSDRPKYEFNDLDTEESSQGIIFVRAFEWRYVPSAGSSKCKTLVVGKGRYQERRGKRASHDFLRWVGRYQYNWGVHKRGAENPIFAARNSLPQLSYLQYII